MTRKGSFFNVRVRNHPLGRGGKLLGACLALGLLATACSGSTDEGGGGSTNSVRMALAPGSVPNYIFPVLPPSSCTTENLPQFEYMMWRPLVWLGDRDQLTINAEKSLFQDLAYDGPDVTITLKDWKWSDGQPITARDVAFTVNLIRAAGPEYCFAVQGGFPSNIKDYTIKDDKTITLHFDRQYNQDYMTWNMLSAIPLMPQHAWGKTSTDGEIGDYDEEPAGAKEVFSYLAGEAEDRESYETNPLWQVVSGSWKLDGYTLEGQATFVPNENYSGPDKAKIDKLIQVPFTSDDAEYAALRAGEIDNGYVPPRSASNTAELESKGYVISPQYAWGVAFYMPNLQNPDVGAILRQQYFRQVLEMLVPQDDLIKTVFNGQAYDTYGPIPLEPENDFVSDSVADYAYKYDEAKAAQVLADRGWETHGDGEPATCERPGTGDDQCGEGIPQGKELRFEFIFNSSDFAIKQESEVLKSVAAKAGIIFDLKGEAANTAQAHYCPDDCSWQLVNYGREGYSGIPTGETMYLPGGSSNKGAYENPEATKLVERTLYTDDPAALDEYSDFIADDLPRIWLPTRMETIAAIRKPLTGVVPKNVFNLFDPQDWEYQ